MKKTILLNVIIGSTCLASLANAGVEERIKGNIMARLHTKPHQQAFQNNDPQAITISSLPNLLYEIVDSTIDEFGTRKTGYEYEKTREYVPAVLESSGIPKVFSAEAILKSGQYPQLRRLCLEGIKEYDYSLQELRLLLPTTLFQAKLGNKTVTLSDVEKVIPASLTSKDQDALAITSALVKFAINEGIRYSHDPKPFKLEPRSKFAGEKVVYARYLGYGSYESDRESLSAKTTSLISTGPSQSVSPALPSSIPDTQNNNDMNQRDSSTLSAQPVKKTKVKAQMGSLQNEAGDADLLDAANNLKSRFEDLIKAIMSAPKNNSGNIELSSVATLMEAFTKENSLPFSQYMTFQEFKREFNLTQDLTPEMVQQVSERYQKALFETQLVQGLKKNVKGKIDQIEKK